MTKATSKRIGCKVCGAAWDKPCVERAWIKYPRFSHHALRRALYQARYDADMTGDQWRVNRINGLLESLFFHWNEMNAR